MFSILKYYSKFLLLIFAVVLLQFLCSSVTAQVKQQVKKTSIVLINGGASGLSKEEAATFFSNLQQKVSQFGMLSVSSRGEISRKLNKDEQVAFAKCADILCMKSTMVRFGIKKAILCKVSKKGDNYLFRSFEYDLKSSAKPIEIIQTGVLKDTDDTAEFVRKVAIKIGQSAGNVKTIPESLQPKSTAWWWYVGSAVTAGVAAGAYFLISSSKENAASTKSLPLPPDMP